MHTRLDCLHSYFSIPDTANPPFYYFLKKYLRYSLESISNDIGTDTVPRQKEIWNNINKEVMYFSILYSIIFWKTAVFDHRIC